MKLPKTHKHLNTFNTFLLVVLFFCLSCPAFVNAQPSDPSRQIIIEDIEIAGNSKTRPYVIFRHLSIKKGDPVDVAEITANIQLLSQTNFFKDVDFHTRPGSERGKLIVVIEVKERKWPYFQFEGGHNDLDNWYFVPASLRFDNLFGRGDYFGWRWVLSPHTSRSELAFRTENLFSNKAALDIQLNGGDQEFFHYFGRIKAVHNVHFSSFRLQLGGTRGILKYFYAAYKVAEYEPDQFVTLTENDSRVDAVSLPAVIGDDLPNTKIRALSVGLYADRRDNPVFPLNGFWGAVSGEVARDQFNSDVSFSKVTFDARFYKRLTGRSVFALHFKGGYVTKGAPFYERFFLGGANSLRGYADSRLTPLGWGAKLLKASAEIRIPISKKNFPYHKSSLILFFDSGGIWQTGQSPKLADFISSAGFGFRVKLPVVGMTRFDFSFPLDNVDNNDFQFHISLGHTF